MERRESWAVIAILIVIIGLRVVFADQPIVENDVGRQIPTAMVARNLERGLGFLNPQLDTAPFPNLFLVEPPIYQLFAVWLHSWIGNSLEAAGRIVSAFGYGLAAWGLYGLCRRREGVTTALIALVIFAVLPVGLRYGRAFQPDALMLGFVVAGLRLWDEFESSRVRQVRADARSGRPAMPVRPRGLDGTLPEGVIRLAEPLRVVRPRGLDAPYIDFEIQHRWLLLAAAWIALAIGFALKVTSAFVLIPLCFANFRERRPWKFVLAGSTLVPALIWYGFVAHRIQSGTGSRAMLDNSAIWMRVLSSDALMRLETYRWLGRFLVIRAFTPVAFALFLIGMIRSRPDRLWRLWGLSALGALLALAAKLHHEYYMLALAVPVSVGAARSWSRLWNLGKVGRLAGWSSAILFLILAGLQSAGTWRTPPEWRGIALIGRELNAAIPTDAGLVAREALLYYSGRRGYRLEVDRAARRRAAGEWGAVLDDDDGPLALLEFYRGQGAEYVADLVSPDDSDGRRVFHEAIRQSYRVLIDRPDFILARMLPRNEVVDAAR